MHACEHTRKKHGVNERDSVPEGGEAPPIRVPSAGGLFLYACLRQGIFSRGAYDGGGEINAKKRARARDSCFLTLAS